MRQIIKVGAYLAIIFITTTSYSEIIFQTNFSEDTGYRVSNVELWNGGGIRNVKPPVGWDGVRASGNSVISVESGMGINGSNALKLKWDPDQSQPNINLGKHLTGKKNIGYDELYIRYHVKLPDNFKAGQNGTYLPYWKWGRLWQNTTTFNDGEHNWTENREDSFYVVWNFATGIPYTDVNATWCANSGEKLSLGSSGSERALIDWFKTKSIPHEQDGYFEHVGQGAWRLSNTDRPGYLVNNKNQSWHTIEFHFKLASSVEAEDGVMELWFDGVKQRPYTRILSKAGAPEFVGLPTAVHGSGFNFFSFFDNMSGWNDDWGKQGVEGFIYVNDVVVSRSYIGHEYIVGSSPPANIHLNIK
jgi:hypothetical protein